MSALPLESLRVIDLTSHVSGPYCSMILADLGADVIKVERSGEGDDARHMPPFVGGEGSPFMLINRNKRSIALDLKDAAERALCLELATDADVFLENFKPGTAERLGLGYEALSALNPRLVYCSISGFGQSGPYRDRGGFDLMTQAMSGIMSVNGPEDGPPYRISIPISDVGAGMFSAIGILSALQARQRTGRGQRIDASLFDTAVALGIYEAAHVFATGEAPPKLGQGHRGSAPYQVFQTSDGWITVGGAAQHLWLRLVKALGRSELADDPRFADNAARVKNRLALVEALQVTLRAKPTAHWAALLAAEGIPAGPVQDYAQVFEDPQVKAREMVQKVEHPSAGAMRILGIPVKLSETPGRIRRPAPLLDQHRAEIVAELRARQAARRAAQ